MKDFLAYYRAASLGSRYVRRSAWNIEYFLIIISGLLVAAATACLNHSASDLDKTNNFAGNMYMYVTTFIYLMAVVAGTVRRTKPSALSLAPVSYKKRAIFSHLTVLLNCLIFVVVWFSIMLAFILFISLAALIFTGEWVFLPAFEHNAGIALYPDALGVLFVIFLFIALFGAGMAISYIKNKKLRYSMLFVCPAVYGAIALFVANMASSDGKFVFCNNMLFNFKNLPLSWLWLTFFAVFAVVICAVSICLALKYEKPKNY